LTLHNAAVYVEYLLHDIKLIKVHEGATKMKQLAHCFLTSSFGASILGGWRTLRQWNFGGRGKLLEILYNVMQRPVGHNRWAYSTGMLR